jgi:hypothetical protein
MPFAYAEDRQLVQVFGQATAPSRGCGRSRSRPRGLRVQARDLVGGRLGAGDGMAALGDQLLDQLGARGLVLNQHDNRLE